MCFIVFPFHNLLYSLAYAQGVHSFVCFLAYLHSSIKSRDDEGSDEGGYEVCQIETAVAASAVFTAASSTRRREDIG